MPQQPASLPAAWPVPPKKAPTSDEHIMAPTDRAQELTQRLGFLPKRFATYGMHVHIGATSGDSAIHLGNVPQALAPLFIAMLAASPFLQMADTGFSPPGPWSGRGAGFG